MSFLEKQFRPDLYVRSFEAIDFQQLYREGIRMLFIDNDNTLMPYDDVEPSDRIKEKISSLKDMGFTLWLLSNGREERVKHVTKRLGIQGSWHSKKPLTGKVREVNQNFGFLPSQMVFIGDQLFTDVWVGKRIGGRAILVHPISLTHDEWQVQLKRPLEGIVMKLLSLESPSDEIHGDSRWS